MICLLEAREHTIEEIHDIVNSLEYDVGLDKDVVVTNVLYGKVITIILDLDSLDEVESLLTAIIKQKVIEILLCEVERVQRNWGEQPVIVKLSICRLAENLLYEIDTRFTSLFFSLRE